MPVKVAARLCEDSIVRRSDSPKAVAHRHGMVMARVKVRIGVRVSVRVAV